MSTDVFITPPSAPHILVADSDPVRREATRALLAGHGFDVDVADSAGGTRSALERRTPSLLLVHIELTGDALGLVGRIRRSGGQFPIVVGMSVASQSHSVAVMRLGLGACLINPRQPGEIVRSVRAELGRGHRPRRRVLAIGAHPDDIESGIGGVLVRHHCAGDEITMLTLTAADDHHRASAAAAARMLDATLLLGDLCANRIGRGQPGAGQVERAVQRARPHIVYVHSPNDTNRDHQAVAALTVRAARRVPDVYGYHSPSSTAGFHPEEFVCIDAVLGQKLALVAMHGSRSDTARHHDIDTMRTQASYWGRRTTGTFAEPLEVIATPARLALSSREPMRLRA